MLKSKVFSFFIPGICIYRSLQTNSVNLSTFLSISSISNNKAILAAAKSQPLFQRFYCKAEENKTDDCKSCETKKSCKTCDDPEPNQATAFSGDVLKTKEMKKLLKAIRKETDKKIYNKRLEEKFLDAIKYASEQRDVKAVIYVQEIWANYCMYLSLLDKAEKIYKATMQNMLVSGSKQTDSKVVKISLKLATIYAHQQKHQLASAGYDWSLKSCRISLKSQDEGTQEYTETQVLLGMVLDSYARYLHLLGKNNKALELNLEALELAKEVFGEESSQAAVLYNSLASVHVSLSNKKDALMNAKLANKILKNSKIVMDNEERAVIGHNYCYILTLVGKKDLAHKKIKEILQFTNDQALKKKLKELLSSM